MKAYIACAFLLLAVSLINLHVASVRSESQPESQHSLIPKVSSVDEIQRWLNEGAFAAFTGGKGYTAGFGTLSSKLFFPESMPQDNKNMLNGQVDCDWTSDPMECGVGLTGPWFNISLDPNWVKFAIMHELGHLITEQVTAAMPGLLCERSSKLSAEEKGLSSTVDEGIADLLAARGMVNSGVSWDDLLESLDGVVSAYSDTKFDDDNKIKTKFDDDHTIFFPQDDWVGHCWHETTKNACKGKCEKDDYDCKNKCHGYCKDENNCAGVPRQEVSCDPHPPATIRVALVQALHQAVTEHNLGDMKDDSTFFKVMEDLVLKMPQMPTVGKHSNPPLGPKKCPYPKN